MTGKTEIFTGGQAPHRLHSPDHNPESRGKGPDRQIAQGPSISFYRKVLPEPHPQRFYFNSLEKGQRRQWHPTPVLLPGKSHGWRRLEGCSPWGRWGSDTTERLHFHFSLSCIGEGNGSPLQCSCLENPRDRGAWWAAIYGVAQSRIRLKWLSSREGPGIRIFNSLPRKRTK